MGDPLAPPERNRLKRQKYKERHKNKAKGIKNLEIPEVIEVPIAKEADIDESDPEIQLIEQKFYHTEPEEKKSEEEEQGEPEEEDEELKISNRQVHRFGRPTIAQLKTLSRRPELIEPCDCNAPDPFTLIELKNTRNVVPVPGHWSQKRKYLNYKRGSETSRYRLPPYLEKTGINKIRKAQRDADENKSLAQKQRDRTRPKTHLLDVSSGELFDAFFKYQTRPPLTRFGDLYFEGKEMMPNSRSIRPGHLSPKLRDALGMGENAPPPWLHKMQKIGPPPSYRFLKIPGLNAPIPKSAKWGYGQDGWGQVPVDASRNPLWGGNPFSRQDDYDDSAVSELWGAFRHTDGYEDGVN